MGQHDALASQNRLGYKAKNHVRQDHWEVQEDHHLGQEVLHQEEKRQETADVNLEAVEVDDHQKGVLQQEEEWLHWKMEEVVQLQMRRQQLAQEQQQWQQQQR